jgi:putative intracellular protease/amidase
MRWRSAGRAAVVVLAAVVLLVGVGAAGVAGAAGSLYPARDGAAPPLSVDTVAQPVHDAAKPTAVVVLGTDGANVADVLPPYEVLADTKAFNVYLVAPDRRPVPLTGGLDVVPDLSFAQLDERLHAAPDVIVVPELPGAGGPSTTAVEDWL